MQIIIELTPEQEAALNYIAAKGNRPATETEPAVVVDPEEYFRARIDDMLTSYAEQMLGDDARVIAEAFTAANEADREAVFAALRINRASVAAEN